MKKTIKAVSLIALGFILGCCTVFISYFWMHKKTLVCTATEELRAGEGIVIPKGTALIHDEAMSEGFDRYKLYININPQISDMKLSCAKDARSFLIIPYWAE